MPVITLVLVMLAACAHAPLASAPQDPPAPVPFPLGVASSDGKSAYMRTSRGAIRAIALNDGSDVWAGTDPAIPLFADAATVLAVVPATDRHNVVRLATIAAPSGERTFLSQPLVLPDWALVGASDVEVRFRTAPASGTMVLDWCARSWYGGGASPDRQIERSAAHAASGSFRVPLAGGQVEAGRSVSALSCDPQTPPQVAGAPPEAFAANRIGDRVYYLIALAPTQRTAMRARLTAADAASGTVHWQREVDVPTAIRRLPQEIRKAED